MTWEIYAFPDGTFKWVESAQAGAAAAAGGILQVATEVPPGVYEEFKPPAPPPAPPPAALPGQWVVAETYRAMTEIYEARIRALTEEISALRAEAGDLKARLAAAEQRLTGTTQEREAYRAEADRLRTQFEAAVADRVRVIRQENETLRARVAELEAKLRERPPIRPLVEGMDLSDVLVNYYSAVAEYIRGLTRR